MAKKAFTLLEILIATFILSVVMLGLISVFMSGKRLMRLNRSRVTAGELGKIFLDPFQLQVNNQTWGTSNNWLWQQSRNDLVIGTAYGVDQNYTGNYTINIAGLIGNLTRVKVDITWNDTEIQ
jgi:prepilin-type N-terminal cleavage/methylation domain-containing protein